MAKLMVTLNAPTDRAAALASGGRVLAEYRDAVALDGTPAQAQALRQAGLEVTELPSSPVQLAGVAFAFPEALAAEAGAATPAPPAGRRGYYLVRYVAPPKAEWQARLRQYGVTTFDTVAGDTILAGMTAPVRAAVAAEPWVENVVPYRPTMKVHGRLRGVAAGPLRAADLAAFGPPAAAAAESVQVSVNVFPGEGTAAVAAAVRAAGGGVLSERGDTVVAVLPPGALPAVAAVPGVLSVLPHSWPKFHNDAARPIMGIPAGQVFGTTGLFGSGQVVGVADSGLDTGDLAALHADFAGRVNHLISLPANPRYKFFESSSGELVAPWKVTPVNDGGADTGTGHGTHVAGSVLGSGAAAMAAQQGGGPLPIPAGVAPQARLYFQAVGILVNWRSLSELEDQGVPFAQLPPSDKWPPHPETLFGLPDDLTDLFQPAYNAGARLHTNSWGAADEPWGEYDAHSRQVDDFMWRHRDFLALFAAGNAGADLDGDGVVDLGSVGPPGTAKNCLTVGASESRRPPGSNPPPGWDDDWANQGWPTLGSLGHVSDNPDGMAAFSSRGPTAPGTGTPGRIKPDVVVPGTNILSARSSVAVGGGPPWGEMPAGHALHGLYAWNSGTSMSTPLVAGAAALVREFLVTTRGHVQAGLKPSGALVKAVLVNGVVPLPGHALGEVPGGTGPNNVTGFGRIDLTRSLLPHLQASRFADEPAHAVATGEMTRYALKGVPAGTPLKVTLVWTDPPGATGNASLTNRLYLTVLPPAGAALEGDVTPVGTATNNVQQVVIANPAAGDYLVRVNGEFVIGAPPWATSPDGVSRQDFAVVVSGGESLTRIVPPG